MDKKIKLLADGLRLAERAHAQYELKGGKDEWPEFYAQWLMDNLHLWSGGHCEDGSCVVDHG